MLFLKMHSLNIVLIKYSLLGIILSTISGILFTANNFIIKEFNVVACDAILGKQIYYFFKLKNMRPVCCKKFGKTFKLYRLPLI